MPNAINIESLPQWIALVRELLSGEFNLSPAIGTVVPEFEWLSEDMGCELPAAASSSLVRRAVISSFPLPESPWLQLDGLDFAPAVRRAAVHAFVCAAAEVEAGQPGVWGRIAELFASGHWPFGLSVDGTILVL